MSDQEKSQKQEELDALVSESLPQSVDDVGEIAQSIVERFCTITPPQHLITYALVSSSGGASYKPGNILLNWRRLIDEIPEVALTGLGVVAEHPVVVVLGALFICKNLHPTVKIELSDRHATALYSMWQNKDHTKRISEGGALIKTNEQLVRDKKEPLTSQEFAKIVDDLCKMECIELTEGAIWLRESVRIRYD